MSLSEPYLTTSMPMRNTVTLVHWSGPAPTCAKALTAATIALHHQCKPQHSDSRTNHETEWSYSVFGTSQHPLCLLLSIHIKDLGLVGVTLDEHKQNGESGHIRWFARLWDKSTVLAEKALTQPSCLQLHLWVHRLLYDIKWRRCDVFYWLSGQPAVSSGSSQAHLPFCQRNFLWWHTPRKLPACRALQWLCLPGLKSYNEQFLAFNELIISAFKIFNSFFFRLWMISLNMMPQLMR